MHNTVRTLSGLEWVLAVWRRRKWLALVVFVALLSAVFSVQRNLPNVYESAATILVEHQQVPDTLAGQSGTGDAWFRVNELETWLRTVIQHTLSRSNLSELITEFDLYPALRQGGVPDWLVGRMRQDIQFQFKGVQQPTGQNATIAFTLGYRGNNPDKAARVANALATLFVRENQRIRDEQANGTVVFLGAQLENAKRQLERQEQRVVDFKARHSGELPEQQAANLETLGRLNSLVITSIQRQDVLARRQVELAGAPVSARLAKLHQELADMRTRYTDEYPGVARVKGEIAALERQMELEGGTRATTDSTGRPLVKDPAVEAELTALRDQEQGLRSQIADYQARLANTPLIGEELQTLTHDYAAASELYQTLLQRYEAAQLDARMGQYRQGDQFRILDSAVVSREPVAPNRFLLRLIGLLVAVGVAAGVAHLAEIRDTSFHGVDDLRAFTSVPMLASIPLIVTGADLLRRRRRVGLAVLAAALGVAAIVSVTSHLARSSGTLVHLLTGGYL